MKQLLNKGNIVKIIRAISFILFAFISINSFAQTYPPSCVIVEPYSNEYFKAGSDINIRVYSTDIGKSTNNGTVTKVEFYSDGQKIGEATSASSGNYFTFLWTCVPAGSYRLTAKATNSRGVSFTSVGNLITVGTQNVTEHGISAGKGKYLANIIANSANTQYNELWNGVTAENSCKWGSVERNRDVMSWGGADVSYNHAKNNNLMFRYHAALWAAQYPDQWLLSLSTADARAEVVEYMEAIAARYPYIDQIDVLNEQLGNHQADNQKFRDKFSGIQNCPTNNFSWQIWLFEEARRIFPNTKLVLNDYGLENDQNAIGMQLDLLKVLRDRGIVDGFGTQAHCFNIDGLSANGLRSSLDRMAGAGVPIYVTELDLNGGSESNTNDAQQLSSYQTHFPVYWEHPAVAGITLWGYVTGATWIGGTGLMSSNGTPKSALTWLKNYVQGQPNVGYPIKQVPQGNCCSTPAPTITQNIYKYAVGATATQLSASGNSLKWYLPDGSSSSSAPTPSTTTAGTYTYSVTQTSGCESMPANITVIVYEPQGPYGGTPHAIPGKIEFEHFDIGGQDSAYYDVDEGTNVDPAPNFRTDEDVDIENCTDTDGGYNLGWTAAGEWTEYTVNVTSAGEYDIDIRVACTGDGKTIALSIDGKTIANDIAIPNTTGWQAWQTITVSGVQLDAGVQVLRMTIGATDYVNLNYMEFSISGTPPTVTITAPSNNAEFTTNDNIEVTATASATDATVTDVKFYVDNQLVNTDNTAPYSYILNTLAAGTYEISALVTDSNDMTSTDAINVVISEAPEIVQLKTGWNLIGCPISGSTEIASALSSIWSHVLCVKDVDNFYLQSQPDFLNTLNFLDWGSGYLIKVDADCDLNWKAQ